MPSPPRPRSRTPSRVAQPRSGAQPPPGRCFRPSGCASWPRRPVGDRAGRRPARRRPAACRAACGRGGRRRAPPSGRPASSREVCGAAARSPRRGCGPGARPARRCRGRRWPRRAVDDRLAPARPAWSTPSMRSPIRAAQHVHRRRRAERTGGGWPALAQRSRASRPAGRRPLEPGDGRGGQRAGVHGGDRLVQAAQHLGRARAAVVGDARAAGPRSCPIAAAAAVSCPTTSPITTHGGAVALQEGVVPVAAHAGGLGGGDVARRTTGTPPARGGSVSRLRCSASASLACWLCRCTRSMARAAWAATCRAVARSSSSTLRPASW